MSAYANMGHLKVIFVPSENEAEMNNNLTSNRTSLPHPYEHIQYTNWPSIT